MKKYCSFTIVHAFLCFDRSINNTIGPTKKRKFKSNPDALLNKRILSLHVHNDFHNLLYYLTI